MKAIKLYCSVFSVCLLFGLCFYVLFPVNISAGMPTDCVNPDPSCMMDYTCEYDHSICIPPATHGGPDKLITWGGKFENCTRCRVSSACVTDCTTEMPD